MTRTCFEDPNLLRPQCLSASASAILSVAVNHTVEGCAVLLKLIRPSKYKQEIGPELVGQRGSATQRRVSRASTYRQLSSFVSSP